jgi:hypothetical protein
MDSDSRRRAVLLLAVSVPVAVVVLEKASTSSE